MLNVEHVHSSQITGRRHAVCVANGGDAVDLAALQLASQARPIRDNRVQTLTVPNSFFF